MRPLFANNDFMPFGFDWTDWRVLCVAIPLVLLLVIVFAVLHRNRERKIRATALFFQYWYRSCKEQQKRSWEADVLALFDGAKGKPDFDHVVALARTWFREVCDEDTDLGLRFTLAQLAPEVLK